MKTFDYLRGHDGIVVIRNFGSKNTETAIYLAGKLFAHGDSRGEGDYDDEYFLKLAKRLAKDLGYAWREADTHIWWRQSFFCSPPKTLEQYDAKTVEAYQRFSERVITEHFESFSNDERHERYVANEIYELSGGNDDQFGLWYADRLKNIPVFSKEYSTDLMRLNYQKDMDSDERDNLTKTLKAAWSNRLIEIFRADKPLDPVAKRARKLASLAAG